MKVLVVDDERPIVDAVSYSLRKEGFEVVTAGEAEACISSARTDKPDIIILDVMLPSASGFDVCKALRRFTTVPIIMLSARAEETDRVIGLELGADDYVTKPFSMRELVTRVKTVLRRSRGESNDTDAKTLEAQNLRLDSAKHEVSRDGEKIELSLKEFDLLKFLMSHPGQALSRQVLLDRVWGEDAYVGERTIDVHIRWLREKIETDPAVPALIQTVRGIGYKFTGGR